MASSAGVIRPSKKSRGGCSRCKSKRIKCDERKPNCLRCEQKGLACPGYQWNVRWSRKHEVFLQSAGLHGEVQANCELSNGERIRTPTAVTCGDISLSPTASQEHPWGDSFWSVLECDNLPSAPTQGTNWGTTRDPTTEENDDVLQPNYSATSPSAFFDDFDTVPFDIITSPEGDSEIWPSLVLSNVEGVGINSTNPILDVEPTSLVYQDPSSCNVVSSPSPILSDTSSALCEYFFRDIVGLYCAWDSPLNYMRNISAQLWQSCAPLYHTMQSMAAVCLENNFPQLRQFAKKERSIALAALRSQYTDLSGFEGRLIALMLLAQTSSWHSPNDLATEQFRTVKKTVCDWQKEARDVRSVHFFIGCMNYWEMILSFVTSSDELLVEGQHVTAVPINKTPGVLQPHEFSGVSYLMVKTLSEVGRLVFRVRRSSAASIISEQTAREFLDALCQARSLERRLLAYRTKDQGCFDDPADPVTTLSHFCQIDEAYRCTGLLQLYRVFPDLLRDRFRPWSGPEELLASQQASKTPTDDEARRWLTELALHILGLLMAIPFESRTRCAQPWLLVAVSNELRYPQCLGEGEVDFFSVKIATARRSIGARLNAYMHVLPLRKVKNVVDLVDLIWSKMDSGSLDTYWVDLAHEQHLSTMMG
ncbi:fungal-specific transcription factor domain-containing protein [Xylariales sp. PMI_506]|nr:fungal-specific transcription factor domain-containing protein [Xylariales sp. PMI_506]